MLQVENVDKETQVTHSNYIHLSYAARNAKRSKVKLSNVERASIDRNSSIENILNRTLLCIFEVFRCSPVGGV